MLLNFILIPSCSHFVSFENDVFRGYKIGIIGKTGLKTKYNIKFI